MFRKSISIGSWTLRVVESFGTQRLYGTVYKKDMLGVGFNTRLGGLYVSLTNHPYE